MLIEYQGMAQTYSKYSKVLPSKLTLHECAFQFLRLLSWGCLRCAVRCWENSEFQCTFPWWSGCFAICFCYSWRNGIIFLTMTLEVHTEKRITEFAAPLSSAPPATWTAFAGHRAHAFATTCGKAMDGIGWAWDIMGCGTMLNTLDINVYIYNHLHKPSPFMTV